MNLEKISHYSKNFFGNLCEKLPLNLTIYENKGLCDIKKEDCEYYKVEGKIPLCNKQTYTLLPHRVK